MHRTLISPRGEVSDFEGTGSFWFASLSAAQDPARELLWGNKEVEKEDNNCPHLGAFSMETLDYTLGAIEGNYWIGSIIGTVSRQAVRFGVEWAISTQFSNGPLKKL